MDKMPDAKGEKVLCLFGCYKNRRLANFNQNSFYTILNLEVCHSGDDRVVSSQGFPHVLR